MFELTGVTKKYGNNIVLNNVSFSADKNSLLFIYAPQGKGKTTLARLIMREEELSGGKISFSGKSISGFRGESRRSYRRNISYVMQNGGVFDDKTPFEHVELILRAAGAPSDIIYDRAPKILQSVRLSEKINLLAKNLSENEKIRLSLAMALAQNRPVILIDEPFGAADEKSADFIMNVLIKMHELGKTVIALTSRNDVLARYSVKTLYLCDNCAENILQR